jgi:LacI family transcriptional regulator, repressor for deo operon, udp, cdd, tsx, nupC, and nupG
LLMGFVDPALTTIRQPVREMSEAVVRVLLEQVGGLPVRRHEYLFRPELIVRGSTGACRQITP